MLSIFNGDYPVAQMWGTEHIIVFVIFTIMSTVIPVVVGLKVKKEKTKDIILIVTASLLLLAIIGARVSSVYYDIYLHDPIEDPSPIKWNKWYQVIPDSLCSLSSFALSISVLINRSKKNVTFHCLIYMAIIGGMSSLLVPTFVEFIPWNTVRYMTTFLHHMLLFLCAVLLIVTNRFRPNPSYWYVMPVGFACYIILGLFELDVMGYQISMNINEPLVTGYECTKWWGCGIFFLIVSTTTAFSYFGYKCLLAQKLLKTKGKKNNNMLTNKVFCWIYYKKTNTLVICYQNNEYQAFNVAYKEKQMWSSKMHKAHICQKNILITKHLSSKYKQVII